MAEKIKSQKHRSGKSSGGRAGSDGSKLADEAIERGKEALKPKPLPPPERVKPKKIGDK